MSTGNHLTNFTHLDEHGKAQMVDISGKAATVREAIAEACVRMQPATLAMLLNEQHPKGDVFAVARIAGIQAAKRTHELIPLCHALLLSSVNVHFSTPTDSLVLITTTCRLQGQTGVEMEALTAASIAALTIYDMCKAVDRGMVIEHVRLIEKQGGASGHYLAEPLQENT